MLIIWITWAWYSCTHPIIKEYTRVFDSLTWWQRCLCSTRIMRPKVLSWMSSSRLRIMNIVLWASGASTRLLSITQYFMVAILLFLVSTLRTTRSISRLEERPLSLLILCIVSGTLSQMTKYCRLAMLFLLVCLLTSSSSISNCFPSSKSNYAKGLGLGALPVCIYGSGCDCWALDWL